MTYTYVLLDATETTLLGAVSQDTPWGPFEGFTAVECPEGCGIRRRGEGWELFWPDARRARPPLSGRLRDVMARHPVTLEGEA